MEFIRISRERTDELARLQIRYKEEIGEERPTDENLESLSKAITEGQILFFGCLNGGRLIACCSIAPVYTTFDYRLGGVFEDFYIDPMYRHKGIARRLVQFAYRESGVSSLTVGCADCDVEMYKSLGFGIPVGKMLAFEG